MSAHSVSVSAEAYEKVSMIAKARNVPMGQLIDEALDAETTRIQALVDRLVSKHIDRRRP